MYTSCMFDPDQRHTSSKVKIRMAAINAAPLQIGQQVSVISHNLLLDLVSQRWFGLT